MHNFKDTVFLIVPTFHNSILHVLTLYESSIQDRDKPVLCTQSAHLFGYYLHDRDVAYFSLTSMISASFPKAQEWLCKISQNSFPCPHFSTGIQGSLSCHFNETSLRYDFTGERFRNQSLSRACESKLCSTEQNTISKTHFFPSASINERQAFIDQLIYLEIENTCLFFQNLDTASTSLRTE